MIVITKKKKNHIHKQSEGMSCLSILLRLYKGCQMKGEKRVQTVTVDGSSSASTSQRVALSSAASVSELKWPHQDRFETLSAAVNVPPVSLPFIRECCIPEWMNRAYRCTSRGTALRSSRCAPVLTDWDVGEERAALLGTQPSLPPSILLSSRRSPSPWYSVSRLIPLYLPAVPI